MRFSTAALGAMTVLSGLAAAIDVIEIQDRHFVNSKTGKPFFVSSTVFINTIIGIIYYYLLFLDC